MPWQLLANHAEILAVHSAYMGFGQILYYGGDEHDPDHNTRHLFDATRLYDCNSTAVTKVSSPHFDAFCSGHAFLGAANVVKLLVGGGTEEFPDEVPGLHHPHFPGLRDAAIFSSPSFVPPSAGGWDWTTAARMNTGPMAPKSEVPNADPERTGGRWYPTLLTLPNGDVIALSGHPGPSDQFHSNDIPEVFSQSPPPTGRWRRLAPYTNAAALTYYQQHALPFFPRAHLLPSGDIICTNPVLENTYTLLPDVGPFGGAFTRVCRFPASAMDDFNGFASTSVLLPLRRRENFRARVLICGGTSVTPYLLDLKGWKPSLASSAGWAWQPTGKRAIGRRRVHANATLLPTGEVLVTGGIDVGRGELTLDVRGVKQPEIYNPYADSWTVVAEDAQSIRNYHSVALLMPDGRVWTAGSDHDAGRGLAARNLDIELFEPWYYSDPGRPHITAAPSLAYPGETIYVESTFAGEIERVVLVRCGSCTHAFNPDQRLLELAFRHPTGDVLLVEMPPDNFIVPPGPYFIFTIRKKAGTLGLPSSGTEIYIVPEHPPKGGRPPGRQEESTRGGEARK
jgi:hypothetical protein